MSSFHENMFYLATYPTIIAEGISGQFGNGHHSRGLAEAGRGMFR